MRLVVQRVLEASVTVEQKIVGSIQKGLLAFVAFSKQETVQDLSWMAQKLLRLRIFSNEAGKFDYDLPQVQGGLLIVSQFTLYGNCMKGNRPDFTESASSTEALQHYQFFVGELKKLYPTLQEGIFQAHMKVYLINDGPVTVILDSKKPSLGLHKL